MKTHFSVFRLLICLLLCCTLIFNCLLLESKAVLIESFLAWGVAAMLILFSAGVVFQVHDDFEIQAIGQNFQLHMKQWGEDNDKADIVDLWFEAIRIDLTNGPGGSGDPRVLMNNALSVGISLWIYKIINGLINIENVYVDPSLSFSASTLLPYTSSYGPYYALEDLGKNFTLKLWQSLPLLEINKYVMMVGITETYLYGFYFDECGVFTCGRFANKSGRVNASLLGVFSISDYELVYSDYVTSYDSSHSYNCKIYYDKSFAEQDPEFTFSSCLAFNFDGSAPVYKMYDTLQKNYAVMYKFYSKNSMNTTWDTTTVERRFGYELMDSCYRANISSVTWAGSYPHITLDTLVGDIAEGVLSGELGAEDITVPDIDYSMIFPDNVGALEGVQNIGQMMSQGDLTLEEYQDMIQVGSTAAETPTFVSSIPFASSVTYYKGQTAAPITVLATVTDGGTLTYEWYRYGKDASGKLYSVEVLSTSNSYVPSTSEVGTAHYYCRVTNTSPEGYVSFKSTSSIKVQVLNESGTDTGTETDSELADKIGSAVGDAVNDALNDSLGDTLQDALAQNQTQQDSAAQQQGNDAANQLIELIPDYSADFLPSVKNLASSVGYEGTSCVLTMPAITIPAVGGLFPQTTLLGEQTINFEDYFNKMPSAILMIVRAVFDVAIVLFCLREIMDLIRRASTGFKDNGKEVE